jgi:phage head maturation protease
MLGAGGAKINRSPATRHGTFREMIYGGAFHGSDSHGMRDVFRGV